MTQPLRVLLFSTLYPSAARPTHGLFVETRLRELLKTGEVDATVFAPVPWFPFRGQRWGAYAAFAKTPRIESRHGVEVLHPRYPLIPKLGMTLAPWLLAAACIPAIRRLLRQGPPPVLIDAHYFYPDGVAAALLAKWFRLPVVITARGSDLNLIARHALPRAMMVWAARHAVAAVAVSEALADALRCWGLAPGSVRVMRNGVDGQRFQSLPASQARQALGLSDGPMLLSVGNLVPLKQHQVPIAVLAALAPSFPGLMLTIIGEGPLKDDLRRQAVALGVGERVHFTGAIAQEQLPLWYSAADLLILASTREGLPNVVLEAMACGTPVVASRVGGVPEVVDTEVCGSLVDADDVQAFVAATLTRLRQPADRQAVRAHALTMSWDRTSQAQLALFRDIQARPHGTRGA